MQLVDIEPQGEELALLLLVKGKRVRATVPVELVNLSAQYGSADLLIRMVRSKVLDGGGEGF
jgi:hypothetical protein